MTGGERTDSEPASDSDETDGVWTRRTALKTLGAGAGAASGLGLSTRWIGSVSAGTVDGATVTQEDSAGGWSQVTKLVADDGEPDDNFGLRIAVDGSTAVVGAWTDDNANGERAGAVYVFENDDGWTQRTKLLADDGNRGDVFGVSVALDGDTLLVGAQGDDTNGDLAGAAYVFERSDGGWTQQTKLLADDGEAQDAFGGVVDIDGDTAVVDAGLKSGSEGFNQGAAYVFERENGEWVQQTKLTADDGDQRDLFGRPVALDGDTILAGAPGDEDPNGEDAGSAYVFERTGGDWVQQAKLTANDGDSGDEFGSRVALDGDTVVVGALGDEDPNGKTDDPLGGAGSVYVFTRGDEGWTQEQKLVADDGDPADVFGSSVTLDGNALVVGAQQDDEPNGESAGAAYVFDHSDDGGWTQQAKLAADDGDGDDLFGASVAMDGDILLVGAYNDEDPNGETDEQFSGAGSAYVFERTETGLKIAADPAEPTLAADGSVDVTVSLTNTGTETASSGSIELTALPETVSIAAVETEGDILNSDGTFGVGDVVSFGLSASPPGPSESVTATFTLETSAEEEGPLGDVVFEGDLNTDDPPEPASVTVPVAVTGGLGGEFDGGNGDIEPREVLDVIEAYNDSSDDRVTDPQTVLTVIAEYNGDGQWGNVDG